MRRFFMISAVACAIALVANAAHAEWTSGMRQGWFVYAVTNGKSDVFRLVCDSRYSETPGQKTHLVLEIGGARPSPESLANIVIDGERVFSFRADETGNLPIDCPVCAGAFRSMWDAIRKGSTMAASFSDGAKSSRFSLRGTARLLDAERCPTRQFEGVPPAELVRDVYRHLASGGVAVTSPEWLTDSFREGVENDRACERKADDQRYASMMWFSGQDWDIGKVEVTTRALAGGRQDIDVKFRNFQDPQTRTFHFLKAGQIWLIDDVTADQGRLKAMMQKPCR